MLDIILNTISGFISGLFIIYWGYIIYDIKKNKLNIKWHHIFILFIYSILFYISIIYFSHLLLIGSFLLSSLVLHQFFFPVSFSKICAGSFIIYLIICFIIIIGNLVNFNTFCDHYWLNSIIIGIITTIFILIFKSWIKEKVQDYDIYNNKSWISIIVVSFVIILIYIFENSFSIGPLILFPICYLLYLLYSIYKFACQKITIDNYLKNYYEIYKFSVFMEHLIDNYKTKLYDTKNQLATVKERINNNDPDIITYLNTLIEEKSHINYSWISELSHFNIPGIKGFISYKIQEMKELGIEIELFISDSIKNIEINLTDNNLKNLYIILGILCDNAKEAAINSINKTISFQTYYDNNSIHIIIANTYDKIISLTNIDDLGVTNNKKKYGTGLYIIRSIIENSDIFNKNTNVIDDYFIQELIINTYPKT